MLVLNCSLLLNHPHHYNHILINESIKIDETNLLFRDILIKPFCVYLYTPGLLKSRITCTLPFHENDILSNPYNDEIIFTVSLLHLRNLGSWPITTSFPSVVCPSLEGKKDPDKLRLQISGREWRFQVTLCTQDMVLMQAHCSECIMHLLLWMLTPGRSSPTAQETSLLLMSPLHQNCSLHHFL